MKLTDKIYIAGHTGLVGSAIDRLLLKKGYSNVIKRSSSELDLRDQAAVRNFFDEEKPQYVFLAAAKVGGIMANKTYPADFIFDNLSIQNNIIHAAFSTGVEKLLFLGSSCIYPKQAPQPIKEDYFMTGLLEPTNEPYAVAKIAGIRMCQAYHKQHGCRFISVMPTNLYGPGDNYHPVNSHVIPALLRRFHEARIAGHQEVVLWGSGSPRREFLHVDDLARACLHLLELENPPDWVNVGTGEDLSIAELGTLIQSVVGYEGNIGWDLTRPDGTPRKLLDVQKIKATGWSASIPLRQGLEDVYREFSSHFAQQRQA